MFNLISGGRRALLIGALRLAAEKAERDSKNLGLSKNSRNMSLSEKAELDRLLAQAEGGASFWLSHPPAFKIDDVMGGYHGGPRGAVAMDA